MARSYDGGALLMDAKAYHREYMQKWRVENREEHNANARRSYHRHKEKYREAQTERRLIREYKMTAADVEFMLDRQGGRCPLCGETLSGSKRKRAIDHDHATGAVRGILCSGCNTTLGFYEKARAATDAYLVNGNALSYAGVC